MLLKKQRNELFNILIAHRLQPADFAEVNLNKYQLSLKASPFNFTIGESDFGFVAVGYPSTETFGGFDRDMGMAWTSVIDEFSSWAKVLQEELETPDLWAEAEANSKLFSTGVTTPNEMFTDTELRQLQAQVRHLEQGLAALALPTHAQKALTATIREIPEKATRFSKKELAGWFMGAFIGQVTQLSLSAENVAAVAHLLKTTFMGLLQLH